MSYYHKELAAGRWAKLSFTEQMANIGSEVERAINWKAKNNADYSRLAAERAMKLLELTLDQGGTFPRLKEVARAREAVADYFFGANEFSSNDTLWRRYFSTFAFAARRNK